MLLLVLSLELFLDVFASWTVAYHLALWARWPAYLTVPGWLVLLVPLVALSLKSVSVSRIASSTASSESVKVARVASLTGARTAADSVSTETGSSFARSLGGFCVSAVRVLRKPFHSEMGPPSHEPRTSITAAPVPREKRARNWTQKLWSRAPIPPGLGLCLLLLGLLAGTFTVTVLRPDYDDLTLFHRVLVQDWREPFLTGDTVTNYPGLPPQSILHVTTSYEPLVGLTAKVVHVRPLHLYYNSPSVLAALALVVVYFLFYRVLGLGEWTAVAAVGLVLVFLTIDGNAHGSFGNMALDRLWQGKCIVWSVLVPAYLLQAYRYLKEPDFRRLIRLVLMGISAVGLSEVGVYTLPILAGAVGLAWLVVCRDRARQLRPAVMLLGSMFYPVAVGAALVLGILHKPAPHNVWNAYPSIWYKNLGLVVGAEKFAPGVVRDLVALILIPLAVLKGRARLFLLSLTCVLFLLTTNPIAAPFWMKLFYQASYWRLAFLFPLPLCAGLTAAAFSQLRNAQWRTKLSGGLALTLFLGTTVVAFQRTTKLPIGNDFKRPWGDQLEELASGFSRAASPMVRGDKVLAPEAIVCTLAMLRPDLRFESSRSVNDPIKFGEVGLESEGRKRVNAQLFTECDIRPETLKAFQAVLDDGVDTVFLRQCATRDLNTLLARMPGWRVGRQNDTFVLLLKQ